MFSYISYKGYFKLDYNYLPGLGRNMEYHIYQVPNSKSIFKLSISLKLLKVLIIPYFTNAKHSNY